MKVWITGARGMLGKDLKTVFEKGGFEVVGTDRAELDITGEADVLVFAQTHTPDVIVNAAAYNAVDQAEDEDGYPLALAVNAHGPRNLAKAAQEIGAKFVHYSSDYVFGGNKEAAYVEIDIPDPISKYGESKALGERLAQEACERTYVLRVSKLFGVQGTSDAAKRSFVDIMLAKARAGEPLTVVDDEAGCPTYTPHLAETTVHLIQHDIAPGIYHPVNAGGGVTWSAFAQEIFEMAGLAPEITPVSGDAFPRKAKRPRAVMLSNTKLPALPSRRDALREYLAQA